MYEYGRDEMICRLSMNKLDWSQEYINGLSDEELYKEVRKIEEKERTE